MLNADLMPVSYTCVYNEFKRFLLFISCGRAFTSLETQGTAIRDETIFSGETLHQEQDSPWPVPKAFQFLPADWPEKHSGRTIATFRHNLSKHCWAHVARLATQFQRVAACWVLKIELAHVPGATLLHEPGQTTTASCNIHKCCVKKFNSLRSEPTTPTMLLQQVA